MKTSDHHPQPSDRHNRPKAKGKAPVKPASCENAKPTNRAATPANQNGCNSGPKPDPKNNKPGPGEKSKRPEGKAPVKPASCENAKPTNRAATPSNQNGSNSGLKPDPKNNKPGPGEKSKRPDNEPYPYRYYNWLRLVGGLHKQEDRTLGVDGDSHLSLDRCQFLVLLVLVCHSLQLAGKEVPVKVPRTPYLSASTILDSILELLNRINPPLELFKGMDVMAVTKYIGEIRKKLAAANLNNLIGNGSNGQGYRLETPPHLVILYHFNPITRQPEAISGQ